MHLGLVCPEMTGHLNPTLALGGELLRRGHRVSVVTAPRARSRVERAGLEFVPVGEREDADGMAEQAVARLSTMSRLPATLYTGRLLRIAQEILVRDLPDAVRQSGIDALAVDQAMAGGAVVAERLGLPYVVLCNALAMCRGDDVPPPPLLWRYRAGRMGRLRNRLAMVPFKPLCDRLAGVGRGGVSPLMLLFEPDRGLACLSQQPAGFDFPRTDLPDHFHYTGPWHAAERDDEIPFPWERLDGRPLIYASLGTLQNGRQHLYAAIAEAAAGLEAQLVIALGNRNATPGFAPPANAIVVPYAPQLRLLDRAALAVTHCGLNTTLECLARGVPMLCMPVANDQPGVARRVEWVGAGEVLRPRRATAARLRPLLSRLLTEPSYRVAAGRLRDEIAGVDGVAAAADVIERAVGRNERVLRDVAVARP